MARAEVDREVAGEDEGESERRRSELVADPAPAEAMTADEPCGDEQRDEQLGAADRPGREWKKQERAVAQRLRVRGERSASGEVNRPRGGPAALEEPACREPCVREEPIPLTAPDGRCRW